MAVTIFMYRERFGTESPWSPDMAARSKSVAGANWAATRRAWTYPKTLESLRALRREFGSELRPDPEVLAWAKREATKERRLRRMGRRYDAELRILPDVAPRLAQAMAQRTYQRSGARFGAMAGSFLLADEPGLGKTAQALAAIIEGGHWEASHLVIAPKSSLDSVWRRQIELWVPGTEVVAMPEGRAKREKAWALFEELEEPKVLVINRAMIRRKYDNYCKLCDQWESEGFDVSVEHWQQDHKFKRAIFSEDWPEIIEHPWRYAVLDESHELLANYKPSNRTQQMSGLLDLKSDFRMALTGTPLRGQEDNLWGTLDWLGHKTGGYWAWAEEYFEVADGWFGKEIIGIDPARRDDFYKTLDRFVLRRTRIEVRKDLPPGKREDVLVDMTPRQAKQYREFEFMGEVALNSGSIGGKGVLSELTRLKQMAYGLWTEKNGKLTPTDESPKFDWLQQFLRERGVTGTKHDWIAEDGHGYKYVVASQHVEILSSVSRSLDKAKIKHLVITGATSQKNRTAYQKLFQGEDKEFRVLLIQTQTGGVSIELDSWCDEMVILDETYVADDQVQLEGRINNRSGRVAPRTWWYVRTAETIEQKIAEGNYMQHDMQHKLLDGRRGVQLALHLIGRKK